MLHKVKFQGKDYYATGNGKELFGASLVNDLEAYADNDTYVHFFDDGPVWRRGKVIGQASEIEFSGEEVPEPELSEQGLERIRRTLGLP